MGMSGANGLVSLTWQELQSFSDLTGCSLTGWESETLMSMSRAYSASYHKSQDPGSPAPWADDAPETIEQLRENVAAKLKAISSGQMPKSPDQKPIKKPQKKVKPA